MSDDVSQSPDSFLPSAHWSAIRQRAKLLRTTRGILDKRGFLEVETPLLCADVVLDRHLDPIEVMVRSDGAPSSDSRPMWLQTSPENCMKRLMVAGGEAIYQITRAFRGGESGAWHNPEFTILEWYRKGDTASDAIGLLSELGSTLLQSEPARSVSYVDVFEQHVGIDPHRSTAADFARAARQHKINLPQGMCEQDIDGWLSLLFDHRVQPNLGQNVPEVVYDWPECQSALAAIRAEDPPVAERFELFFRGVELANGYHELTDADELVSRQRLANEQRKADGKPELPESEKLLQAMQIGLPACSGVAVGLDRILMLNSGVMNIEEVLAFPFDSA